MTTNTARLAEIESEIDARTDATATLRAEGARLLADMKTSGQDVAKWLTTRGATETEATDLIVEIIKERRASGKVPSPQDLDRAMLERIDRGGVYLSSPADGFRYFSDDRLSMSDAQRIADLKERRLVSTASYARGESYPTDGWPQPLVLTDTGRAHFGQES